ncbi:hypothetical protein PENTCL1PPCAC_17313, partial [Pristionchus entomophagus]
RMMNRMKSGAQLGSYFVARTFQVKENVEVLRYMSWIGRGWLVSTAVCSLAYSYFTFGPNGYDLSRSLSYNIFEIFVALNFVTFYILSITGNTHILKQFRNL